MEFAFGILLLLTLIVYMYGLITGKVDLMVGTLLIAVAWTVIGLIAGTVTLENINQQIFHNGPLSWGTAAVIVAFGSFFGRVLVTSGIAATLIRKTVELGGDRVALTTVLLCIVTTLIFTSTFGVGAVIAICSIVVPILLAMGVPKVLAVVSFCMSVSAGAYMNPAMFSEFKLIFDGIEFDNTYFPFGIAALLAQLVLLIIFVAFSLRKTGKTSAWAATAAMDPATTNAPWYSLITPVLPVLLTAFLGWQVIPSFLFSAIYGFFTSKQIRSFRDFSEKIPKLFSEGVIDIAALLGFLFVLPMLDEVAVLNTPLLQAVIGNFLPTNPLVIAIAFAILAPLSHFGGPLAAQGCGIATVTLMVAMGVPVAFLFPVFYVLRLSTSLAVGPNQSWNAWAMMHNKITISEFFKIGFPLSWLCAAVNILLAYFMFGV